MDDQVTSARTKVIRHRSPLGSWEYDMQAPVREPNIFVGLHYPDARAALAFLDNAFGFRKTLEVPGAIFVDSGPINPADWGDTAQAIHVHLADPDAHHAHAAAAGATITKAPFDTPGARGYYARDLDGFLWGFSNYKPGL